MKAYVISLVMVLALSSIGKCSDRPLLNAGKAIIKVELKLAKVPLVAAKKTVKLGVRVATLPLRVVSKVSNRCRR